MSKLETLQLKLEYIVGYMIGTRHAVFNQIDEEIEKRYEKEHKRLGKKYDKDHEKLDAFTNYWKVYARHYNLFKSMATDLAHRDTLKYMCYPPKTTTFQKIILSAAYQELRIYLYCRFCWSLKISRLRRI